MRDRLASSETGESHCESRLPSGPEVMLLVFSGVLLLTTNNPPKKNPKKQANCAARTTHSRQQYGGADPCGPMLTRCPYTGAPAVRGCGTGLEAYPQRPQHGEKGAGQYHTWAHTI